MCYALCSEGGRSDMVLNSMKVRSTKSHSVSVSRSFCDPLQASAKTDLNLFSGANSTHLLLKACDFLAVHRQLLCGLNLLDSVARGRRLWGVCEGWGLQGYYTERPPPAGTSTQGSGMKGCGMYGCNRGEAEF